MSTSSNNKEDDPILQLALFYEGNKSLPLSFCVEHPDISVIWNNCNNAYNLAYLTTKVNHVDRKLLVKSAYACVKEVLKPNESSYYTPDVRYVLESIEDYLENRELTLTHKLDLVSLADTVLSRHYRNYLNISLYYLIHLSFSNEKNSVDLFFPNCISYAGMFLVDKKDVESHLEAMKVLASVVREHIPCPTYQQINQSLQDNIMKNKIG